MSQKVLSSKAKNYNIIEVVGLPGAGKSTLIEGVLTTHANVVSPLFASRFERRWYSLLYILLHPLSFTILFTIFVVDAPTWSLRQYTIHLLLVSCARYQKASRLAKQGSVIIDEGLWQRVITLSTIAITKHDFIRKCILFALPKKIKIVFVDGGDFSRFRTETDPSQNARLLHGSEVFEKWSMLAKENATYLRSVLPQHVLTHAIEQQDIFSERLRNVVSFL